MINFRTLVDRHVRAGCWTVRIEAFFLPEGDDLFDRIDSFLVGDWVEAPDGNTLGVEIGFVEGLLTRRLDLRSDTDLCRALNGLRPLVVGSRGLSVLENMNAWLSHDCGQVLFERDQKPIDGLFLVTDHHVDSHVNAEALTAHMFTRLDAQAAGRTLIVHEAFRRQRITDGFSDLRSIEMSLLGVSERAGMRLISTNAHAAILAPRADLQHRSPDPLHFGFGSGDLVLLEIPETGLRASTSRLQGEIVAEMIDIFDWCIGLEEAFFRNEDEDDDSVL